MGCTPSFLGRPKTTEQHLIEREAELKKVDRQLVRILADEQLAYDDKALFCRNAVQRRKDMAMARLYAEHMLRHRDNGRLIEQARLQIGSVIGCLHQVGQQHVMELTFRSIGVTLRKMNRRMPVRDFSNIARRIGVELGRVDTKRKRIKETIDTHMQLEIDDDNQKEISDIISQFSTGPPRIEELSADESDDPMVYLEPISDDDDDDDDDAADADLTIRMDRLRHT